MQTYFTTISTKGQIALPAEVRKKIGIDTTNRGMIISYNPKTQTVQIKKASSLRDLQNKTKNFGKKAKPLLDPGKFYNKRTSQYL